MRARELAVQNFSVARHLLQLHQLFRELREHPVDEQMRLGDYSDPELRLRQIILKNFEWETLYDTEKIGKIASILTVRDFWRQVADRCGVREQDIRSRLNELISRRNQIAHRADRPDEAVESAEGVDGHGLRAIHFAWVSQRVTTASSVMDASSDIFRSTLEGLEGQIEQEREQQLARQTLADKEQPL